MPIAFCRTGDTPNGQYLLPSLVTPSPQERFDLAVKLARMGVTVTQFSDQVRDSLRAAFEQDSAQLIAITQVIAVHFKTIAGANDHWRPEGE